MKLADFWKKTPKKEPDPIGTVRFWLWLHRNSETFMDELWVWRQQDDWKNLDEPQMKEIELFIEKTEFAMTSLRDALKLGGEQLRDKRRKKAFDEQRQKQIG